MYCECISAAYCANLYPGVCVQLAVCRVGFLVSEVLLTLLTRNEVRKGSGKSDDAVNWQIWRQATEKQ
jgi:hypothetical protein